MAQHYSNEKRAGDPHVLPDVETFHLTKREAREAAVRARQDGDDPDFTPGCEPGWYWWVCFPGCLPDSEPMGPFATEAEALADAQEGTDDDA